jgi:titin
LKIFSIKKVSMPKVAVLATGLVAAVMVATISPANIAQAHPRASTCASCHGAGGSTTAVPSTTTPVGGATYTVAIAMAANAAGGDTGYGISPVAPATGSVFGGETGTNSLTYTATMTAPAAAGTYVYNVFTNQGSTAAGQGSSTTYTITVGSAPTTVPPTTVPPTTVPPTTVPPTTVPPTTVPPTTVPETNTPGAPTNATATAGNGSATVSWDAPKDDGGLPILGYLVIANDGQSGALTEGAETTVTVPELTNGKSYTFTVIAFNDGRNLGSEESVASNAVTPSAPSAPSPTGTATATDTATTPATGAGGGTAVIPVGAPDTGAGGASNTTDGPLAGLGGLALLIAGAGATQVIRRRQQV